MPGVRQTRSFLQGRRCGRRACAPPAALAGDLRALRPYCRWRTSDDTQAPPLKQPPPAATGQAKASIINNCRTVQPLDTAPLGCPEARDVNSRLGECHKIASRSVGGPLQTRWAGREKLGRNPRPAPCRPRGTRTSRITKSGTGRSRGQYSKTSIHEALIG